MLFKRLNCSSRSTSSVILPRGNAGEEQRWGLERSVAVELSEAIERIERFFMRNSDAEKNCPLDR